MPHYDIMCVLSAKASAPYLVSLFGKCADAVVKHGGVVRYLRHLGLSLSISLSLCVCVYVCVYVCVCVCVCV